MAKITAFPKDMSILNQALGQVAQNQMTISNLKDQVAVVASLPVLKGTGDPEGKVVANVGALYLRLDGSTSTTLYVKETGVNTPVGWVAK